MGTDFFLTEIGVVGDGFALERHGRVTSEFCLLILNKFGREARWNERISFRELADDIFLIKNLEKFNLGGVRWWHVTFNKNQLLNCSFSGRGDGGGSLSG